mmetsp:Transcript_24831/g.71223  ORF Transcript_24831/g.71223 Transcript_24831/m.71223 type:complete len:212 (+) Transcript_24831:478-1113(+)
MKTCTPHPLHRKLSASSSAACGGCLSSLLMLPSTEGAFTDVCAVFDAGRGVVGQLLAGEPLLLATSSREASVSCRFNCPSSELCLGVAISASLLNTSPGDASPDVLATTRYSPSTESLSTTCTAGAASMSSQSSSSSLSLCSGLVSFGAAFTTTGSACCLTSSSLCGAAAAVKAGDAEVDVVEADEERSSPQTMARSGRRSHGGGEPRART